MFYLRKTKIKRIWRSVILARKSIMQLDARSKTKQQEYL